MTNDFAFVSFETLQHEQMLKDHSALLTTLEGCIGVEPKNSDIDLHALLARVEDLEIKLDTIQRSVIINIARA